VEFILSTDKKPVFDPRGRRTPLLSVLFLAGGGGSRSASGTALSRAQPCCVPIGQRGERESSAP